MHENAARALQYYEELPRRSGRPDLRLVETEPRPRRRDEAEPRSRRSERHRRSSDGRTSPTEPRRRGGARPQASARARAAAPARQRLAFPIRRRTTVAPRIAGRPDRVAMWAVLLGFFLTAVAAATGHG